jgi:hypothetical protein
MKMNIFILVFLAGLWFSACKTTPEPSTPTTPLPQTSETTESPSAPTTQPQQSETAGAPSETKTSQEAGPEASETSTQAPTEKDQAHTKASKTAGESLPPEPGQKPEAGQPQAPSTAEGKLEKAREDLRISEATEQKIAAELEKLKQIGTASPEEISDYETYHERVEDIVAENRDKVEKMERAYRQHSTEGKAPQSEADSGSAPGETIPEEQTDDQVAELDRQLMASLSQFDTMLLKEMETIETQSAAKTRDLAQEAAEAARRLKEKGVDLGGEESESAGQASEQEEAEDQESTTGEKGYESEQGDDGGAVASSDRPKGQGSGSKDDRGSRYSKEDDDIVARQLREAAENETDPELKEKLWKEYEEYKKNTQ